MLITIISGLLLTYLALLLVTVILSSLYFAGDWDSGFLLIIGFIADKIGLARIESP